jgi:hypothetical protein
LLKKKKEKNMATVSKPRCAGKWATVDMPQSHLPIRCVAYPAGFSLAANPVMFLGIPGNPATGSDKLNTWPKERKEKKGNLNMAY